MRMFISALALSIGLTTGGLAAGSYGLSATVFDPSSLDRTATELLNEHGDSDAIVNQLDRAMGVAVDTGTAANGDPAFAASVAQKRATVRAAATSLLNDPQVREAVKRSIATLRTKVDDLSANPTAAVQGTSLSAAAKTELAKRDPALAAALPAELNAVTISAHQADGTPSWLRILRTVTGQIALIALGLIGLALLIAPNRAQILRRIGRWAMMLGGVPVLLFVVLPNTVLPMLGGVGSTVADVLHGSSGNIVAPAEILAVTGLMLFVASGAVVKRNAMLRMLPAGR